MPAMLDDPTGPRIQRWPAETVPPRPTTLTRRHVTLRDGLTTATILPLTSQHQIPTSLLEFLCAQLNHEIQAGDTYPMVESMPVAQFGAYWFQTFTAVMVLDAAVANDNPSAVANDNLSAVANDNLPAVGNHNLPAVGNHNLLADADWSRMCLGSYYIKPNYPGRSSHVCNAGFLVTEAARGLGVGSLLAESYLAWAPKLGFTYSVFNLVYETNVASCKIWDRLGFERIGRVKGCGRLKSYPDRLVDAIVYGRELTIAEDE